MKFSLVIPCYNEGQNLSLLLKRCQELIDQSGCEIIIVNNGSTDNTQAILRDILENGVHSFKYVDIPKNIGYGHGILQGLHAATGQYIGWTHADLQTNPLDCLEAWKILEKEPEAFVKGLRKGRGLFDIFFTSGMSLFETILLKKPMRDINAQPTIFSRDFIEHWTNPPSDFSIDLYAYYQALLLKKPIKRFSVYFGKRLHGKSSWNDGLLARLRFIRRTIAFSFHMRNSNL